MGESGSNEGGTRSVPVRSEAWMLNQPPGAFNGRDRRARAGGGAFAAVGFLTPAWAMAFFSLCA